MQLLTTQELFNDNIVTIFTDASSISQENGRYLTSSAVAVFIGYRMIKSCEFIFKDSTISIAELFAVYQGVKMGYEVAQEYGIKTSFLFSDSKYSIDGLTEWLGSWVKKSHNGVFVNSNKTEVAHQHIFQSIMYFINNTNYNIRFVKIKGHVNTEKELCNAINYINKNNYVFRSVRIDYHTVDEISRRNDLVDMISRESITGLPKSFISRIPSASNAFPIQFLGIGFEDYIKYINNIKYPKGVEKENGNINY